MEGEHGFHKVRDMSDGCCGLLLVEAKRLGGNLRHARKLLFRHFEVTLRFFQRVRVAGEEEEIGDCFERIVDFVGDGGREATDDSEFLRLAQGFFRLLLGVDVSIGAEPANDMTGGIAYGTGKGEELR